MRLRRLITCGAITFSFMTVALSNTVAAGDDNQKTTANHDCDATDSSDDNSRDVSHDAGERDRDHEHDGYSEHERSKRHRHGPVHVRRHYGHGHDGDCEIEPPAEVAEAPLALLLPASGALTGGAAVLLVRRRNKNARINAT